MKETYFDLNDPRLAEDVLTLDQAIDATTNEDLKECMEDAIHNGYFLVEVNENGYLLEKLEVEN